MNKKEKVEFIMNELERLYPAPPVPLDHTDPYTLLIAVLLSAQCTDARVNTVTPALFELADSPKKMASVSVDEIKAIIRPCGLSPAKSKISIGCLSYCSSFMPAKCLPILKLWKHFQVSGIKRPLL